MKKTEQAVRQLFYVQSVTRFSNSASGQVIVTLEPGYAFDLSDGTGMNRKAFKTAAMAMTHCQRHVWGVSGELLINVTHVVAADWDARGLSLASLGVLQGKPPGMVSVSRTGLERIASDAAARVKLPNGMGVAYRALHAQCDKVLKLTKAD